MYYTSLTQLPPDPIAPPSFQRQKALFDVKMWNSTNQIKRYLDNPIEQRYQHTHVAFESAPHITANSLHAYHMDLMP
jgi:hypothetical protein